MDDVGTAERPIISFLIGLWGANIPSEASCRQMVDMLHSAKNEGVHDLPILRIAHWLCCCACGCVDRSNGVGIWVIPRFGQPPIEGRPIPTVTISSAFKRSSSRRRMCFVIGSPQPSGG